MKYINNCLFFIFGLLIFSGFLKADNIVISHGWNLIGNSKSIRIDKIFNKSIFKIIWGYKNGKWEAYSPDENISNLIKQKYTFFTETEPYQGIWIYNSIEPVSISLSTDDSLINLVDISSALDENITDKLVDGWNLVGSSEEINLKTFAKKTNATIVWGYKNGKWEAYSSDKDTSNLIKEKYTFFTETEPYQGIWVYKQPPLTDLPSFNDNQRDNNQTIKNIFTLTGYVETSNPVANATIEVYDKNGNLIAKEENATDQNGKYSIKIKGDSSSLPVLLKVTDGEIKGTKFDSSMWGICFDEQCNVTPITSIVALLFATDISNTSKEQLSKFAQVQLGIANWQSLSLPEYKNIAKYLKDNNVSLDYIVSNIVSDLKDNYIDDTITKQFFPNGEIRKKITKNFIVDTSSINDFQNRNLKLVNFYSGKKTSITGSIPYQNFGYEVGVVEDLNYTLYDDTNISTENVLLLPFNAYSQNKIDINSTIYNYLFMDSTLSQLNIYQQKSLISVLTKKYPLLLSNIEDTYKKYINYGILYQSDLFSQLSYIQDILKKELKTFNVDTKSNNQIKKALVRKALVKVRAVENNINSFKNKENFGGILLSYDKNNNAFEAYNFLPMYYGFTSLNKYSDFIQNGGDNYFDLSSIRSSFNHQVIDKNKAGMAGIAVSTVFSIFNEGKGGKQTEISIDALQNNEYVLYKNFKVTSLQGVLNVMDPILSIIKFGKESKLENKIKDKLGKINNDVKKTIKISYNSISTASTIIDSLTTLADLLINKKVVKFFNLSIDDQDINKTQTILKDFKNIKSNLDNLEKQIENIVTELNMDVPKPNSLKEVFKNDEWGKSVIYTLTGKKPTYNFITLKKIPTYDGKHHFILMLLSYIMFYDQQNSFKKYYQNNIKTWKKNNSAYIKSDDLIKTMYILFNALNAQKLSNNKIDRYAYTLNKDSILKSQKGNRQALYKALTRVVPFFKESMQIGKNRNTFVYNIEKIKSLIMMQLNKIKNSVKLINSATKIAKSGIKAVEKFDPKQIADSVFEYIIKPVLLGGINRFDDVVKDQIEKQMTNLIYSGGALGKVVYLANEIGGKAVSYLDLPNKITLKVSKKGDDVYFSSALNGITPIAFEKGIVLPNTKEEKYMQKSFLKRPTGDSFYGVIVADANKPSWYRPYFETIFKEKSADVIKNLSSFVGVFAKVNWQYEQCQTDAIQDKYTLDKGLCYNFNNNSLSYIIDGSDLTHKTIFGDSYVLPYPDKTDNNSPNSYFDFFDIFAQQNDKSFGAQLWGPYLKNAKFRIPNNTRGIYLDKLQANYYAFDDDTDPKFQSPSATDVLFKIASAKDFEFTVENDTNSLVVANTSNDIDLTYLIIKTADLAKNNPPSYYSFDIPYSLDTDKMKKTILKSNISYFGDNITIIAVDSILKAYAKYIGEDNLMQVIYSLKPKGMTYEQFFNIYSDRISNAGYYPFMKIKNLKISIKHRPSINNWNINSDKLTATLSVQATDPDNDPLTCSVNWGDGISDEFDCSEKISHTYVNAGDYTILVTASDNKGLSSNTLYLQEGIKEEIPTNTTNTISTIKKTGQTKSYDTNGNEVTDGSLKDDGYYQKGVTPSYTRDDAKGIVTDNITKLQWQDNEEAKTVTKTWQGAKDYCSALTLGGYTDWRLPTAKELSNIVDYGKYSPAIDTTYFHNISSNGYWSSTTYEGGKRNAWIVGFYDGYVGYDYKDVVYYVRCVRDGQ